ncbi:unnamed protein product, partial [Meganyctiphanes norvegica]
SPTWIVEKGLSAIIPLEPSRQDVNPLMKRTHVVTLWSDDDFTPCYVIDGHQTCLTLKEDINPFRRTLEQSPLRTRKMDLYLELVTVYINIYKKVEGEREDITSFPKQGVKFIELTSENTNFSVSLNILQQHMPATHDSVVYGDRENLDSGRDAFFDKTPCNKDIRPNMDNGMLIGIFIGLTICVLVMAVLVSGYIILR